MGNYLNINAKVSKDDKHKADNKKKIINKILIYYVYCSINQQ